MTVATYFHPETCMTKKPVNQIEFIGQSLPYYDQVRNEIRKGLKFNELPLRSVDIKEFYSVHSKDYIDTIVALSNEEETGELEISAECYNLHYAVPGYEYGLGGIYSIIDLMKRGVLDRAYSFSLGSHHAFPGRGHGYCLLNTMAAGVRYAQSVGFKNVLIVDWDIHHGDGTQTIFENDESVYCIDIHSAVDLYMSMVKSIKLGTTTYGESVGYCNIPVMDANYPDDFFYKDLELTGNIYRADNVISQFEIELNRLPFSPDIIFIFDGHDSHVLDCGKDITNFDYNDFRTLTKLVKNTADKYNIPILSIPGGGYDLDVTAQSALVHVDELFNTRELILNEN